MALDFAKRIVGYGCYNLHFDRGLGACPATGGKPLLTYIRSLYKKVNHIKVIIFRNAMAGGVVPDRAVQLYRQGGTINQELIDNLRALVEEARRLEPQFWVQICIWHYHALKYKDLSEYPEHAPVVLAPNWDLGLEDRLAAYYAPSASRQAAFAEHKRLFERIGREFGGYDNVIFELGNEMRIRDDDRQLPIPPNPGQLDPNKAGDERNLKAWLATNLQALRNAAPGPIRVCTSTGIDNEYIFFKAPGGLAVDFFDFHSGEWGMTDDTVARHSDRNSTKYPAGIRGCRDNAAVYKPGGKVLINTDGLFRSTDSVENSGEFAQLMQNWVGEAFQKGVSFVTNGFYPPKASGVSRPMLDALEHAANSIPEP